MSDSSFWLSQFLSYSLIFLITAGSGWMVLNWGVRVAYTRKIMHFAYYLVPMGVELLVPYPVTPVSGALRAVLVLLSMGVFTAPVRERVPLFKLAYVAIDRPEDRPHTLNWIVTQMLAGMAVVIVLQVYLARLGRPELLVIPTLINVFGDGLAEPVGVRFGRYRYQVRALFSQKRYTRSDAGSACVFVSGVVALLLMRAHFSFPQLVVGLALIPLLMTLTEAFSPHTWDTPFLFLVGGLGMVGLVTWVP